MLNNSWKDIVKHGGVGEEFTSVSSMTQYKIQVTLELLEGCSYMCPGCFVKRRGNWNPKSIKMFHNLAYELHGRTDVVLDDIVIGPTDFYGAENLEEIIHNTRLSDAISMIPEGNRNIQHNCSIMGSLSEDDILGKIKAIEKSPLGKVVESWDVQIALDLVRVLDDKRYRKALRNRVMNFKESSLDFEISMATNIVDGIEDRLYEAIDYIRETYDTVIEILPSVVRSFNHSTKHGDKLFAWNDMLTNLSSDVNRFKNKFHFLQGDLSHKAFHYAVVNIHNGKLYASPFIYENAQIYKDDFEITTHTVEGILNYKHQVVTDQILNSSNKECGTCKYLNVCSNRLIPKVMDTMFKGRSECILNKDVIALFDNEDYHGNSY
jgi:hypothetical protein